MRVDKTVKRHEKPLQALCAGCFVVAITVLAMLFMNNYQLLQDSLSLERTVYISELSAQLVDKVSNTQEMYYHESRFYAKLLEDAKPDTFSEAAALLDMGKLENEARDFLVDGEGHVYTLQGEPYALEASDFLLKLLYDGEEADSFYRNDRGEESWIFGCPMEGLVLDGIEFRALLKAYDGSFFKSSFALELFNQNGHSFIVNRQGAIIIGSQTAQSYGYNLFSSFRELGVDEEVCSSLEFRTRAGESGQIYAVINHADWLVQFDMLSNKEQYVFVMVPVSVTAAMPFQYMNQTLMTGLLTITTFALCFFLILFLIMRANRRRDAAVYQAELLVRAAQAKSDFMSRMSHDIRTPLNVIIGMNYIARDHLDDRERVEDSLKKMDFSANYLLELINDMLDMQKIESGKMVLNLEPFSLRELLEGYESVLKPSMENKNLQFEIRGMEDLAWNYVGDKLRISRILMNLLSNASKFTPEGGQVILRVDADELEGETDRLTFTVEDTGIGISKEYMEHLFQPFEQESGDVSAQFGGSGLGLSIVYNLVQLMNGEIQVESIQGAGSRFQVSLPLRRDVPEARAAAQTALVRRASLAGKRVLLVEDNELNLEIAKTVLEMHDLIVEAADNGQTALERFEASSPGYYDMIITDIRMPIMDGYQLSKAIRAGAHPDGALIPVLAMSANAFDGDIRAALEAGMNAHLSKPLVMEELEQVLQQYLCEQRGSKES